MKTFQLLLLRARQEIRRDGSLWLTLLLASTLLLLPNAAVVFIPSFSWPSLRLWLFSLSLLLMLGTMGLRVRTLLWLSSPLLILVPACVVCVLSIQNLPTTFLMLALLETNQAELTTFKAQALYTAVGTLALAALYLWLVKARVSASSRLGPVARVFLLACLVLPSAYDFFKYGAAVSVASFKQRCLSTFPCSTFYAGYEALALRARVQERKNLVKTTSVQQDLAFKHDPQRQVHMLVIGESATRSCFSLYGYERPTTPLLERTAGLLPFRDVTAAATVTLVAVPSMITSAPPGKVLEATRQASLLTAYRKAGFRVYWLSSQRKHGTFDTLNSLFSEDADESVFKGGKFDTYGSGAYDSASDTSLLPLVTSILNRKEPKVLFVLHTIGSHGPYPARYSDRLTRFPADRQAIMDAMLRIYSGVAQSPHDLQLVQDSYDNTIFATDFLLANLIHLLRGTQASSWFCYVSDHGENTSKALLNKFMHGIVSRQVVEIPMLMWLSPDYTQRHPQKAATLRANLDTPFSATSIYHTLLDMGGLACADFKAEQSAAAMQFSPGPRLVCDSRGKITDYDRAFPPLKSALPTAKHAQALPISRP